MAVLGAQVVLTLVMVSVIQKLNPHISFAKRILCSTGLYRYLHPTDDVLRAKAGVPKEKPGKNGSIGSSNGNTKNKFLGEKNRGQFHIPRNIEMELETVLVEERDVVQLRYFTEYAWLVDFSIYASIVYIFSEIYHFYFPLKNEANLSMVWCLLVVFFAVKLLSSLTVLYFQSEESIGERSMVIVACLVYLLIAMIVLIIDESILETGLEEAYSSFNESASKFLIEQGLPSSGPASKIVVKFFLAFACGVLGALYTFPGLRMAKMHWDSLKYCKGSRMMQFLLNFSFILPFILVILWIRPISRDYLTVRIFEGMDKPLLKVHIFETLRLLLVVLVVLLRFALLPVYLQSYLNIAHDRIVELRKQAGRITNIEYQKKISSIFYYLCVVTLQFAAPLILCLFLTLMYKSLGGFSWSGILNEVRNEAMISPNVYAAVGEPNGLRMESQQHDSHFLEDSSGADVASQILFEQNEEEIDVLKSAQSLHASFIGLKNVFSTDVYRGFLGFATWWSYFTLFATTSLGIVYQSYFNKTYASE